MSVTLAELCQYSNTLLEITEFNDYCPNGLQVEACENVERIVSGVTASQALIEAAIDEKADVLLVHHGYFWKGEPSPLVGFKGQRVRTLMNNAVSLLAYHLPLDAHAELGNNACLARLLGIEVSAGLDGKARPIGNVGEIEQEMSLAAFGERVEQVLSRKPLLLGELSAPVKKIGFCTGGAQSYFDKAIAQGVDCFITGEVSEQVTHLVKESGVAFIAAGHHATERYGVQALGQHLANRFGLEHKFIEIDNPV